MDLIGVSEIVVGGMLTQAIKPHSVEAAILAGPYDELAQAIKSGSTETDLTDRFGAGLVATCKQAIRAVQGVNSDWLEVARRAALKNDVGQQIGKASKLLISGQDVDDVTLLKEIARLRRGDALVTPASEVVPEIDHFWSTGWSPFDDAVGGIPRSGLTILAALPKSGKTTLLALLALLRAKAKKHTLIFTFEMRKDQFAGRLREIGATKKDMAYILLVDTIMDIDALSALAARYDAEYDLDFIGADSADLIVRGKIEESSTTEVYRGGANLAHELSKPFILIGHFNDGAYKSGIPRVDHIRYSRMAIAFASLIAMIYQPNNIWSTSGDDARLPIYPNQAYLIFGASRWGFGDHPRVGAARVDWDGKKGWGGKLRGWHDLGDAY